MKQPMPAIKLNPNHPVYRAFDKFLEDTTIYTPHAVAVFIGALGEAHALCDPECQDVLITAVDIPLVRRLTNKRPQRTLSQALTVLYKHTVERKCEPMPERATTATVKPHIKFNDLKG